MRLELLQRSWPVGFVALACGVVYCVLLCLFPDAIEALDEVGPFLGSGGWGGVEVLFLLNSLLLGWGSIVVLEYRLGMTGPIVFLIGLMCWIAGIGGGFALARVIAGGLPGHTWEMILFCIVSTVVSGALRVYLSGVL